MATVFILPRLVMPINIHRMISAPITRHHIQLPISATPPAASAPSYIIMAVQPTSCRTLSAANSMQPFCPKLIFVDSMALRRELPPITPAKNSIMQPITWPVNIAARPVLKPMSAKYVPVSISASDTPAPNHIRPFSNIEVRFSIICAPPLLLPQRIRHLYRRRRRLRQPLL